MKPALSQICSLDSPFEKDIEDYAAGQGRAIEIWLTKLETYLQSHSIDDVRRLVDRHEVTLPVASYQGGLLDSQGEKRNEAWSLFTSRLVLCQQLGIGTIVVACDVGAPFKPTAVERIRKSLEQAAQLAADHGRRIALEFQAKSGFANNLQSAAALVAEVASPQLGLCLDVFHYYVGPSKPEDLAYLSNDNLFHVQLCDLAGVPREFATDSDRVLPGDGDIMLEPILNHLQVIGYDGHVSIELMNPQIWRIPALQFGEIAMKSLRKILGQAAM